MSENNTLSLANKPSIAKSVDFNAFQIQSVAQTREQGDNKSVALTPTQTKQTSAQSEALSPSAAQTPEQGDNKSKALSPSATTKRYKKNNFTFDFAAALEAGHSKGEIIDFVRNKTTNIDWQGAEKVIKDYKAKLQHQKNNPNIQEQDILFAMLEQGGFSFYDEVAPSPDVSQTNTPNDESRLESLGNRSKFERVKDSLAGTFGAKYAQDDVDFLKSKLSESIAANKDFASLPKALQQYLEGQARSDSLGSFTLIPKSGAALYDEQKERFQLANKPKSELTEQDKAKILSRAGFFERFFASDDEIINDTLERDRAELIVTDRLKNNIDKLNNIHQHKSIASILLGSDEQAKQDYLKSSEQIALDLGFEGIGTDKNGALYVYKNDKPYKVERGFFESLPSILQDNAGTISAGIAGSLLGAKYAPAHPATKLGGAIIGGALGSAFGGALDVVLANAYLNRKNTAQEIIAHATQEGVLSALGDGAILGVSKLASKVGTNGAKKVLSNIIEYTPFVGFATRALNGNAKSAQKLINHKMSEEQQAALKDFAQHFGGEIHFANEQTSALQNLTQRFPSDSFIAKGAQTLSDIFSLKTQREAQKDFIRAIRADESGNLTAFIAEAANASPIANANLNKILHDTTSALRTKLAHLQIKPREIKEVFDTLEQGTKQSYTQAIEDILAKLYDTNYKTTLDRSAYRAFRKELEESGVLKEDAMRLLNFVENNIYNEKGVTFTQLNNALKTINAYYKEAKDPNFKSHIKNAVENFLRDDIKQGISNIFSQNNTLYKDAQTLFDTALSDYANMKTTLKMADKLKLRDRATSYERALKNLLGFTKGQGEPNLSNLAALTKDLNSYGKESIELNLLNAMLENALLKRGDIEVFDSKAFLEKLASIEDSFSTRAAKDYITIIKDFHTLFVNDALIAKSLKSATTDTIGSSIATTLEGAVKFQAIKMLFENIVRLMPHIPFARGLNEKIQGAALRYHIRASLKEADSISDFKFNLQHRAQKGAFNNDTKTIINKLLAAVDSTQDTILEQASKERARSANAKNLQTKEIEETIPKDLQEKWVKEFGLKSVDEEFVPSFSLEVKEALSEILGDEQIKLGKGSLVKLIERDRLEFLPYIKQTLENSDIIIRDNDNALIFAKDIGHTSYFTSVSKNENGEWVVATNSYKTINQLKNRVNNGGEVLYLSKEAPNILAEAFTAKAFPSELKTDSTTTIEQYQESLNNALNTQGSLQVGGFNIKGKSYDPEIELLKISKANRSQILSKIPKDIYTIQKDGILIVRLDGDKLKEFLKQSNDPQESKQVLAESIAEHFIRAQGGGVPEREMYKVLQQIEFLTKDTPQTKASLPSIEDNLKKAGYIGIEKGEEIEYFSKGLPEFGTNYPEFYHNGAGAIAKLLETREGQVAGAFHKEGLGDIDLVWGEVTGKGKEAQGFGLAKILEKHIDDFSNFAGDTPEQKLINGLVEIVDSGKVETKNDVSTIYFYKDDKEFKIGLSKGWNGEGENKWVISAYENKKYKGSSETSDHDTFTPKEPLGNLDKADSTIDSLKMQNKPRAVSLESNAHIGSAMLGGSVAGVESDEEGNIVGFDPQKFALGFLGGVGGSVAVGKIAKNPKARAVLERLRLKNVILPLLNKGEKVDSKDVIKVLQTSPQKGRDMIVIGQENLSKDVLEWIVGNNKKVAIDRLDSKSAKELGFKYPTQVRRTIGASEINHTLKRHGEHSGLVQKSGQKPVSLEEIAKWTQYADSADKHIITKDDLGQEVLVSAKQINGYYVVVESIRKKHNELAYKTMYFENGSLQDNEMFK